MRLAILLFLGGLGAFTLLLTLAGGVAIQLRGGSSGGLIDAAGGLISALVWGLFALGATDITQLTDSGAVVHTSSPAISMLGVIMGALSVVVALFGVVILVDVSSLGATPQR